MRNPSEARDWLLARNWKEIPYDHRVDNDHVFTDYRYQKLPIGGQENPSYAIDIIGLTFTWEQAICLEMISNVFTKASRD